MINALKEKHTAMWVCNDCLSPFRAAVIKHQRPGGQSHHVTASVLSTDPTTWQRPSLSLPAWEQRGQSVTSERVEPTVLQGVTWDAETRAAGENRSGPPRVE